MEHIKHAIEAAEEEIGSMTKSGRFRSREDVDTVYKLMDIVKDGYCIMEDYGDESSYDDGGMSMRRGGRGGRPYAYNNYDDGSYARGRGRGAKRYADGRYAPYSRDGDYRDGYSRDKSEFADKLRSMMDEAPDEQTRMNIKRMVDTMND